MSKKILTLIILIAVMMIQTSCVSYAVARSSEQRLADRGAIVIEPDGDRGIRAGIDLLRIDVLREQPVRQIGAAVVDGLILYAVYDKYIDTSSSGIRRDTQSTGIGANSRGEGNATVILNNSTGNTVSINQPTSNTTNNTPTPTVDTIED